MLLNANLRRSVERSLCRPTEATVCPHHVISKVMSGAHSLDGPHDGSPDKQHVACGNAACDVSAAVRMAAAQRYAAAEREQAASPHDAWQCIACITQRHST